MVASTVTLSNWEPSYLNLLCNSVNIPSPAKIHTALVVMPTSILLYPMADGDAGATTVRVHRTVYVPPPFVPILLVDELSPVKAWHRLQGTLATANLEVDCWAVTNCLKVALIRPAPNALPPLLMYEPTAPLVDPVILKHCRAILIRYLPGLDPSMIWATGSLIVINIGDLVSEQLSEKLEVEALQKRKEDRGQTHFSEPPMRPS